MPHKLQGSKARQEFQNNLLELGIEQNYHYVNEKAKKFRVGKKTNQIVKKMRQEDK